MPIITISRGSYSRGKEVAEKVATSLDYACLGRSIVLEASEEYNIPEIQLVRALEDAPSFWERFSHEKERYVAYIRAAFLKHMQQDNVVYHGLAGQFFLQGVSHVLKVRILADIEDRVQYVMEQDQSKRSQALYTLKKKDEARRKWSLQLYGIDTTDPTLYDLVLHIDRLSVEDAAHIIGTTAQRPPFVATPESRQRLADLVLAASVEIALVEELKTSFQVSAKEGDILVKGQEKLIHAELLGREIHRIAKTIPGVSNVDLDITVKT